MVNGVGFIEQNNNMDAIGNVILALREKVLFNVDNTDRCYLDLYSLHSNNDFKMYGNWIIIPTVQAPHVFSVSLLWDQMVNQLIAMIQNDHDDRDISFTEITIYYGKDEVDADKSYFACYVRVSDHLA